MAADAPKPDAPATPAADGKAPAGPQMVARAVGQYIKDLSFENPNVAKLLDAPAENPNIKISIDVHAKSMGKNLYESAIDFKAHATGKIGTIYELELLYAGLFRIENAPEKALEPMLLVNCPMLLFPFVRRIVLDATREGGFPPLMLDPVDFAQLYLNRQKQLADAAKASVTPGKA